MATLFTFCLPQTEDNHMRLSMKMLFNIQNAQLCDLHKLIAKGNNILGILDKTLESIYRNQSIINSHSGLLKGKFIHMCT